MPPTVSPLASLLLRPQHRRHTPHSSHRRSTHPDTRSRSSSSSKSWSCTRKNGYTLWLTMVVVACLIGGSVVLVSFLFPVLGRMGRRWYRQRTDPLRHVVVTDAVWAYTKPLSRKILDGRLEVAAVGKAGSSSQSQREARSGRSTTETTVTPPPECLLPALLQLCHTTDEDTTATPYATCVRHVLAMGTLPSTMRIAVEESEERTAPRRWTSKNNENKGPVRVVLGSLDQAGFDASTPTTPEAWRTPVSWSWALEQLLVDGDGLDALLVLADVLQDVDDGVARSSSTATTIHLRDHTDLLTLASLALLWLRPGGHWRLAISSSSSSLCETTSKLSLTPASTIRTIGRGTGATVTDVGCVDTLEVSSWTNGEQRADEPSSREKKERRLSLEEAKTSEEHNENHGEEHAQQQQWWVVDVVKSNDCPIWNPLPVEEPESHSAGMD